MRKVLQSNLNRGAQCPEVTTTQSAWVQGDRARLMSLNAYLLASGTMLRSYRNTASSGYETLAVQQNAASFSTKIPKSPTGSVTVLAFLQRPVEATDQAPSASEIDSLPVPRLKK